MENMDYSIAKEFAYENEPVFKRMDIESVQLLDQSNMEINSRSFMVEEGFVKSLTKQIGLDDKSIRQLSKNMSKEEVRLVLNKSFSNYFRNRNPLRANIIGDKKSKKLFRLNRGEVIPYSTIFDAVDSVENQFNKIEAEVDRGDVRLLMNESEEIHIEGLIKEAFSPNMLLNYFYGESFGVAKVIERLTCTNQITQVMAQYGQMNLAMLNSPISIIKKLSNLKSNNVNNNYSQKVMKLQGINASVDEYEYVSRLLTRHIGKKDTEMLNLFLQKDRIDRYINSEYSGIGNGSLIANDYTKNQSDVPLDYWFLINSITDFASHNYRSLNNKERDVLKEKAFNLLERVPDMKRISLN
jgi:hypothetical protein